MAVGNPVNVSDAFGESYTFWTEGTAVKFETNLRSSITAFSQVVEDSPVDVTIDDMGEIVATYLDSDGDRLTKSSKRDGDSGTWS